nr:FAD-dependent oxidoreductase [Methyloligella sp. GL2]
MAAQGCSDVVLLEKAQLTSGTTWHAAGAVGQLRSSASITRLIQDSTALYSRLEAETEQATGWVQTGSLRLACTPERRTQIEASVSMARTFGLDAQMISAAEAQSLFPVMQVDDVLCAAWMPSDGKISPSDVTVSLAKGARMRGVKIFENTAVTGLEVKDRQITAVLVGEHRIECEAVVLCAGLWTRQLAATIGVNVPLQPTLDQYAITEPIEGLPLHAPSIRDPDHLIFVKEEVGGIMLGGYELNPVAYTDPKLPQEPYYLFQEDLEQFESFMTGGLHRIPALAETGIRSWVHGLDSFTEDGMFILGEAPEVRGVFVGAGFNGFGIAAGGGAGKALASWVLEGEAPYDLWPVDICRFTRHHRSDEHVRLHAYEGFANHYGMGDPALLEKLGRPLRRTPFYDRLKHAGAVFEPIAGWECPAWFETDGDGSSDTSSAAACKAAEETAILSDLSPAAKFAVLGSGAATVLKRVFATPLGAEPGSISRALMLTPSGRIRAEADVLCKSAEEYLVIGDTARATLLFEQLRRAVETREDAFLVDETSGWAIIGLAGPNAPAILQAVVEPRKWRAGLAPGTGFETTAALSPVWLLHQPERDVIGWTLHVPTEYALAVWDAIVEAGAEQGMVLASRRSLSWLSQMAGKPVWGIDFSVEDSPAEAGLEGEIDSANGQEFIGAEAFAGRKGAAPERRLAKVICADPNASLSGKQAIYLGDEKIGWTTSGGARQGGNSIALGYIRTDGKPPQGCTVEVRTERVPVEILPLAPAAPEQAT